MLDALYFSDKQVQAKLFARAKASTRPLVVSLIPPHRAANAPHLEPWVSLERAHGDLVDFLLVVDEGKAEGMWRDPVNALAEALWPDDAQARTSAARGALVVQGFEPLGVVPKGHSHDDDAHAVQALLAQVVPGIPPPRPRVGAKDPMRERPTAPPKRGRAPSVSQAPTEEKTVDEGPAPASEAEPDAWAVLGLAPGTPLAEAKKAWRALLVQYHPDKVAHLAPEFRALAEAKTRELNEAWSVLEPKLED